MNVTRIRGGRVIDPANRMDEVRDLWLVDDKIALTHPQQDEETVIEAGGLVVAPGLLDIHVHFREPGQEGKETIKSGSRAAVAGGFTTVACMPNTEPAIDTRDTVRFVLDRAKEADLCRVFPIGAMTKERKGKQMAEIGDLVLAGVVAVSDDGNCLMDSGLMRWIMQYSKMFNIAVIQHAEDHNLTGNGVVHEGLAATEMGYRGMPGVAEDIIVARDIMLTEVTGCHLHVAHVSTARSVELIRQAKQRGLPVTTEVTPHHFTLTDEAIRTYDTNMKMKPPLRSAEDVAALKAGLIDGTIDCIVTDHAPHASHEKFVEFDFAPFGITGLETSLGLVMRELVKPGLLSLNQAIALMTHQPAQIIRQPLGTLSDGAPADVTIFDPNAEWVVDADKMYSKAHNTPFGGWTLYGKIAKTIVGGKVKFPF